jgi:hypothetical protein
VTVYPYISRGFRALLGVALLASWHGLAVKAQVVFPINQGKIVFHRYTDFSNYDGQLYVFDLATRELLSPSTSWDIDNTTNAHFSPDGTQIVFMGVPRGQHNRSSWDIYLWTVGSSTPPRNLTEGNGVLDQDPKFFPDGTRVAFKHDGDIAILEIATGVVTTLTTGGSLSEKSMEYPTRDGKSILFAEGDGAQSAIYSIDIATKAVVPLVSDPTQNYYPIVRDDSTFLYARWQSATNHADEIYLATFDGRTGPVAFDTEFADESDPYPVDSALVLFSSTRAGGKGGYDLYVGNLVTGATRSLALFNLNTPLQELGVCYTANTDPLSVGDPSGELPGTTRLGQNYPNPCNPETTIEYVVESPGFVELALFDLLGREIAVLVAEDHTPGDYRYSLNSGSLNLSSGVYVYRLSTAEITQSRAFVVVR